MYRIVTGKITERCEYPVSHRPNQTSRGPQADFLRNCAASLVFSGRRGVAVAAVHVPRRPRKVTERLFGHFSRFGAQLSRRCRGDVAESSRSVAQLSRNCRGVVAEMSRSRFFQKISIFDDFCSFSSEKPDFHSVDDKNGHRGLSGRRSRRRRRCDCHCDNSTACWSLSGTCGLRTWHLAWGGASHGGIAPEMLHDVFKIVISRLITIRGVSIADSTTWAASTHLYTVS